MLSRTDEGLNILRVKRPTASELRKEGGDGSRAVGGGKKGGPNTGWGNNFVRYDMKVSPVWPLETARGMHECADGPVAASFLFLSVGG